MEVFCSTAIVVAQRPEDEEAFFESGDSSWHIEHDTGNAIRLIKLL
jgi:hypothetical protein